MMLDVARRVLLVLVLAVFMTAVQRVQMHATILATSPLMAVENSIGEADASMADMPCKGVATGCYTDLGCILLVGLASVLHPAFAALVWNRVTYATNVPAHSGRIVVPVLGPPIRSV